MVSVGTICKRRCWHPIVGFLMGGAVLLIVIEIMQRRNTIEEEILENAVRTQHLREENVDIVNRGRSPGETQYSRVQTLRKVCQANNLYKNLDISELWKGFYFVDKKHEVVYCGIPKVGCTFLKRLFFVLSGKSRSKNPYDISANVAHGLPLDTFQNHNDTEIEYFIKHYKKVLFVRDPIQRLISGYNDKIKAMNPGYWLGLGRGIVKQQRQNPSQLSQRCGHDVTFQEFLEYRIYQEIGRSKPDMHWDTVYRTCNPCMIKYDFIGKMESFNDDVNVFLDQINARKDVVLHENYTSKLDNILIEVQNFYDRAHKAAECGLTFDDLIKRYWEVLIHKKLINPSSTFPDIQHSTTKEELIKIMTDMYHREEASKTLPRKSIDELESVSKATIMKLQEYYNYDYEMFGYNKTVCV